MYFIEIQLDCTHSFCEFGVSFAYQHNDKHPFVSIESKFITFPYLLNGVTKVVKLIFGD